jgi:hypothetical protein
MNIKLKNSLSFVFTTPIFPYQSIEAWGATINKHYEHAAIYYLDLLIYFGNVGGGTFEKIFFLTERFQFSNPFSKNVL